MDLASDLQVVFSICSDSWIGFRLLLQEPEFGTCKVPTCLVIVEIVGVVVVVRSPVGAGLSRSTRRRSVRCRGAASTSSSSRSRSRSGRRRRQRVVVVVVVAVAVVVVLVLVLVLAVGAGRSAAAAAAAFRRCRQYVSEVCSALIFDAASELSRLPKFA